LLPIISLSCQVFGLGALYYNPPVGHDDCSLKF
jgi:hypothetical protein